ncbi:hypothetical protein [Microcoleus anatoxicus]|uniref:hypothetical protein n=1 Tax=Microcoleus anatoxicus TaxID=2705319 RepID=UPI0030C902E7
MTQQRVHVNSAKQPAIGFELSLNPVAMPIISVFSPSTNPIQAPVIPSELIE